MSAALRARQKSSRLSLWLLRVFFLFLFFFFLDSTSLQSIVTSRQPRTHSLAPKSACLFRFLSLCQTFHACEELPGGPIRCWTLGPIFRRSLALKLNFCHLLGGFDFSGDLLLIKKKKKSLSTEGSAKQNRRILQRFSRAANKVGFSTQPFGTQGGGVLLKYCWRPLGVSAT